MIKTCGVDWIGNGIGGALLTGAVDNPELDETLGTTVTDLCVETKVVVVVTV